MLSQTTVSDGRWALARDSVEYWPGLPVVVGEAGGLAAEEATIGAFAAGAEVAGTAVGAAAVVGAVAGGLAVPL